MGVSPVGRGKCRKREKVGKNWTRRKRPLTSSDPIVYRPLLQAPQLIPLICLIT